MRLHGRTDGCLRRNTSWTSTAGPGPSPRSLSILGCLGTLWTAGPGGYVHRDTRLVGDCRLGASSHQFPCSVRSLRLPSRTAWERGHKTPGQWPDCARRFDPGPQLSGGSVGRPWRGPHPRKARPADDDDVSLGRLQLSRVTCANAGHPRGVTTVDGLGARRRQRVRPPGPRGVAPSRLRGRDGVAPAPRVAWRARRPCALVPGRASSRHP